MKQGGSRESQFTASHLSRDSVTSSWTKCSLTRTEERRHNDPCKRWQVLERHMDSLSFSGLSVTSLHRRVEFHFNALHPDPSWSVKGEDTAPRAVSLSSNHPLEMKSSPIVGRGIAEDVPGTWLPDTEMVI